MVFVNYRIFRFKTHPNRGALAIHCPTFHHKRIFPTMRTIRTTRNGTIRIYGGKEPDVGQYPWVALLGYSVDGNDKLEWRCGGSLIGDRYILTAAHCVTGLPEDYKLYVTYLFHETLYQNHFLNLRFM